MGVPTVTNIIVGGATLWYAPVGEAIPDETSVAFGGSWGGNWAKLGFTKAPLTLAYEREEADIEVEEALTAIKRVATKEDLTVETVLAELTSDYLGLATSVAAATTAAGAGQTGFDEIKVGGNIAIDEYAWGFEAEYITAAGVSHPVRLFIHKGTAMLNGQLEFSNRSGDYPGIPLQIKALVDSAKTKGEQLFHWQRVTAAATS